MRAVVTFESVYGNTRAIAEAVGEDGDAIERRERMLRHAELFEECFRTPQVREPGSELAHHAEEIAA